MRRWWMYIYFFLAAIPGLRGQQLTDFYQLRSNYSFFNPAFVDFDFYVNQFQAKCQISHNQAITAFPQPPKTSQFQATYFWNRGGTNMILGGQLGSDQLGRYKYLETQVKYAILLTDDLPERGISFGMQVGLHRTNFDWQNLSPQNLSKIEPFVSSSVSIRPLLGIGIYGYHKTSYDDPNYIFGGISVPALEVNGKRDIHIYAQLGYRHQLVQNSYVSLVLADKWIPSAQVQVFSALASASYHGLFNISLGMTTQKQAIAGIGLKRFLGIDEERLLDITYSTFIPMGGGIQKNLGLGHEIIVGLAF